MHERYPRLYRRLKAHGHCAVKAIEILIDARRGNRHALMWVKCLARIKP